MPKNGGANDRNLSFLDVMRRFIDPDGPLAQLYSDTADVLLTSHTQFAKSFNHFLDQHKDEWKKEWQKEWEDRSPEEKEQLAEELAKTRELLLIKAVMTAYIDMLKSRPYRNLHFFDLQERMLKTYLDLMGDVVNEMKQAKEAAYEFWSAGGGNPSEPDTKQ